MVKPLAKIRFFIAAVLFFTLGVVASFLLSSSGTSSLQRYDSSGEILGTYIDQHIYAEQSQNKISEDAYVAAQNAAKLYSWRTENSVVLTVNSFAGDTVTLPDGATEILSTLYTVCEASGGVYDYTVLPLIKVWGFDTAVQYVPDDEAIEKALLKVGYKNIIIDTEAKSVRIKNGQPLLYLENVLEGIACDEVIKTYIENNAAGGLVAIGENMASVGGKGTEEPWNVQLRDPNGESTDVLGTLRFYGKKGVATKGIYQTFFIENNKVYNSILNAQTGKCAQTDIISATVISNSCTLSSAAAYACVAVGKSGIPALAEALNIEVIAVDTANNVYITSGIKDDFSLTADGYNILYF